jgi:hypothetical protein
MLMWESQRRVAEYRCLWGVTFECIAHDVGKNYGELEYWYRESANGGEGQCWAMTTAV